MAGAPLQLNLAINAQTNADQAIADVNALLRATESANQEISSSAKRAIAELRGFPGKVETVNEIRFETDASGLKQAVAVQREILQGWDDIEKKIQQETKAQKGSLTSLRGQVTEAKQLRDSISKVIPDVDMFGREVKKINPVWDAQNEKVARLSKQLDIASASNFWQKAKAELGFGGLLSAANGLNQLVDIFQSIGIVIGQVTAAVNGLTNSFKEIQSFQMSFEAIGAGASAGTAAFRAASEMAARLGTDLQTTRDGFKQLAPVVLGVGGNMDDVAQIMGALSTRFAAFGRSAEESRRIMNGITQAFAKGKLMSEELTQQIAEADPAFKTDLARAIGVSSAALEVMVKQGKITGKELIAVLPKMAVTSEAFKKLGSTAGDAAKAFADGSVTITQVGNKFKTLETLSFEQLGRSLKPFLEAVLKAQAAVIDFISSFAQTSIVRSLGESLGIVVQTLSQVIQNMLSAGQSVLGFIKPLLDLFNTIMKIPGAITVVSSVLTAYLFTALFKAMGGLEAIKNSAISLINVIKGIGTSIGTLVTTLKSGEAATTNVATKLQAASGSSAMLSTSLGTLGGAVGGTAAKMATIDAITNKYKGTLEATSQAANTAAAATSGVGATMEAARARVTALGGPLAKTKQDLAGTGAAAAAGAQGLASYLPTLQSSTIKASDFAGAMEIAGREAWTTGKKTEGIRDAISKLSPEQVGQVADKMMETSKRSDAAGGAVGRLGGAFNALKGPINGINTLLNTTLGMMLKFEIIVRTIQLVAGAFDFLAQMTQEVTEVSKAAKDAQIAYTNAVKEFGPGASAAGAGAEKIVSKTEEVQKAIEATNASVGLQDGEGVLGWLGEVFLTDWGAIGSVANSIGVINKALADSANVSKAADTILSQYNKNLGEYNAQNVKAVAGIKQIISSQDQLIARLQAEYDEKARLMKGSTTKPTQEEKEALDALAEGIRKLSVERDKLAQKATGAGIDLKAISDTTTALDGMTKQIEAAIKKAEELGKTDIETIKVQLDVDLKQLDLAKDKEKKLYEQGKEQTAQVKEDLKEISDKKIEGYQQEKDKITENKEAAAERYDAEKDAISQKLEQETAAIDATISRQEAAHSRRMAQYDEQADRANEAHSRTMAQIDAEERSRSEAITRQFTGAPGSATNQLAKLDELDKEAQKVKEIEDLRKAGKIAEAQKAQERWDLEKRAAEEQKREEEAKQRLAEEMEKKRANARIALENNLAAIEADRQAAEAAHEASMAALEEEKQKKQEEAQKAEEELAKQIEADKKKAKEEQAALDKQIEEEKKKAKEEQKKLDDKQKEDDKKYKEEMAKFEEKERKLREDAATQIKAIEDSIKATKEEAAKVMAESNAASEASLGRQLALVQKMVAEYAKLRPPGAAAGGPVSGGSTYTVNELGKEAFLSASGRLSMINAPSWGSWRAPSAGIVIPAHLTSQLSIPSGGVNLNRGAGANTRRISRSASPLATVMAALQRPTGGMTAEQASNISATQAQQAVAIGKLSRAVRDLSNKDWNVRVQVKGAGGTTNYLHTLNTLR